MSTPLLLRAFVNERLTAAAQEIFDVFERTITKYEEEACSSQQEIERLRGMLLDLVSNQKTDISQSAVCKEETEQQHCQQESSVSVAHSELEPRHVKEEDEELWTNQQQEEQVQEFKDVDVLYLPHPSSWRQNEQGDTKPPLQPQTQMSESEEQFKDLQGREDAHLMLPLPSQPLIHIESVQGGREKANQTQTEQSQSCVISDLSHLNSVKPSHQCYLCDKSFSSKPHLVNHAFRMHSKDTRLLCAVCGKAFESTEILSVHLKSHKGAKFCHVCGKQCNSTTVLTEHMASHAGVKLHRCHICGKECSRKGDLKIHMRIHTGEKPFRCSHCLKSFTHSGHLKKHMRSHTGERPHQCELCGRGFLQKEHLKYHLRTHARKY